MASEQRGGEHGVDASYSAEPTDVQDSSLGRPARRWITTATAGLLAAGTLVSCGGNETSSSQFPPPAGTAPPATTTKPVATINPAATTKPKPPPTSKRPPRARGARLGCGTYCQAAGILNGGAGGGQPAVTVVPSGPVTADADGYAPVVLTCNLTVQCQGSLVLSLNRPGFQEQGYTAGKSDVVVDAGATTTIDVPLDAVAVEWLQSHGPTGLGVIVDAGLSFACDGSAWAPDAPTKLGLPPCGTGEGAPVIDGFDVFSGGDLNVAPPEQQ